MILETSFLIDMLKGGEAAARAGEIDRSGEEAYLPSPALFELWLGAGRSRRPREEMIFRQSFAKSEYSPTHEVGADPRLARGSTIAPVPYSLSRLCVQSPESGTSCRLKAYSLSNGSLLTH